MKPHRFLLAASAILSLASTLRALDGEVGIHDPSTIVASDGRYYTYGTGGNPLVSDDGWSWRAGAMPLHTGMAPDVIHVGDRYYMYISRNVGAQPKAEIEVISNRTLDPASPDYKWEQGGLVATTDGIEDCNGIDPGLLLDPTTGKLWMTYGSYFGYIRLVELDPKTGKRVDPNSKPIDIAINCEASIMIYHEGWYYLLATHGSCCQGANSNYNIRMGRSRNVAGPFLDRQGVDMMQGGGTLFLGSESRLIGPGHFGRLDLGQGVEVFSYHYEEDLDHPGNFGNLEIRPLLWRDGWPVAGENAKAGTFMVESVRTGTVLELAVEGAPVGGVRSRGGRGGRGGGGRRGGGGATNALPAPQDGIGQPPATASGGDAANGPGTPAGVIIRLLPTSSGGGRGPVSAPIPPQDVAVVSKNWPTGDIATRMANFLDQAQQKWTLTAVADAGGYPGAPYFKITLAGTDRALAATAEGELITLPAFTGGAEQLWRIQQLTDGTYRIMPKVIPGTKEPLALSAVGSGFATLSKFNPDSDRQRWNLKGL